MSGGAEHGIGRWLHDIVKVADLSPSEKKGLLRNGLANRRAWVRDRDPDSGAPSDAFVARPSPYSEIPVTHPVGGGETGPNRAASGPFRIGTQDRSSGSADERLSLGATVVHVQRAQEPDRGIYPTHSLTDPKSTPNLSAPLVQVEGAGAEKGEIAKSAPLSDVLRVLDGAACLLGNDAAEMAPVDRGRPVPGGGNMAWAATLPGRGVQIRTRIGDALAPMKHGIGTPFSEPGIENLTETGPGGTVIRGGVNGSGGAGGAGGAGAGGGAGGIAGDVAVIARDQAGNIRAYDAQGRPIEGVVLYRDSNGLLRWSDTRNGRTGSAEAVPVYNVAPAGYHGTGTLYDGFIDAQGRIVLGIQGPTTGAQFNTPADDIIFASPITFRDESGTLRQAVGIRQVGAGHFELIDDEGREFNADVRQDSAGNVYVVDPTTGRNQVLGSTNTVVGLGIGGGLTTQINPATGEREIVVGIAGGTLHASINGIVYAPSDPGYAAIVAEAQRRAGDLEQAEFNGQGAGGPGGPGSLSADQQEELQVYLDIQTDAQNALPLGTTTEERHRREAGDEANARAAELARRPLETGCRLETLFGPYAGLGYPISFNRPLSQTAKNLTSVGTRWAAGYMMEISGFWHPVTPLIETAPKKPGDPTDGGGGKPPPPPPPPPPTGKKGPPPRDPTDPDTETIGGSTVPRGLPWGENGGRERVGGDGQLTPCDRGEGFREPPGGGGGGGGGDATPRPGEDFDFPRSATGGAVLLSRAPGTDGARSHREAGLTEIDPLLPPMDPNGDERQRLGGGPYMRGAPLVPRGGIRLIDSLDVTPDHTNWDLINFLVDKVNQLTSLVNERFPFAPDAINGAGLALPQQPAEKVRMQQFDAGTVLNVPVDYKGTAGSKARLPVLHMVARDKKSGKLLARMSPDRAPSRTLGTGEKGADVEIRFDTGYPEHRGRGKRGDPQPKMGWDGRAKELAAQGADFATEALIVRAADGSETKIETTEATGATAITAKGTNGIEYARTLAARAGGIVLAPSALTANTLPRADSNGDIVDSALVDNGTSITVGRATVARTGSITHTASSKMTLSATSDLALSSASGFADITAPSIRFNGSQATDAQLLKADNTGAPVTAGDAATVRTLIGLGTIATQDADSVVITGGSITTIDDIAVADGGTGASTAADARTNLGLGTIATQAASAVAITGGTIDGTTLGDLRLGKTSQTASNGGNYNVASTIATVFVDASALGTTNNYDVTLPSAVTYASRLIVVKITTVGTGSATVTVKSAAGTVEGVAAATGVPLDATARSRVLYQSDGTNWWKVSP